MEHSSRGEAQCSPGMLHVKAGSGECYLKSEWSVMLGRQLSAMSKKQGQEHPGENMTAREKTRAVALKRGQKSPAAGIQSDQSQGCRGGGPPRSQGATRARQDAGRGSFGRLESSVWSVTSLRRGWGGCCDDEVPADGTLSSRWPEGRW